MNGIDQLLVYKRLAESNAQLHKHQQLEDNYGLAIWSNHHDHTSYQAPGHHTLSCYIEGGFDTVRRSGRQRLTGGAPGKICLMPADHQSDWEIEGHLSFVHLYFNDAKIDELAEQVHDSSFSGGLPDLTWVDNSWIMTFCQQILLNIPWHEQSQQTALSQAGNMLILHLLSEYGGAKKLPAVKGGLAPATQRFLIDYIEANLGSALTIEQLAAQVQLSPYHFARMFKQSFAQTPHHYITERRLQAAYQAIRQEDVSLSDLATGFGFSDQSHFGKAFKKRFKQTPSQYRRACSSAIHSYR